MGTLAKLREIYIDEGPKEALRYAEISGDFSPKIISLLRKGKFNPFYKPRRPRRGKTARQGGLRAAKARKEAKRAKDRALRAAMKGPSGGQRK